MLDLIIAITFFITYKYYGSYAATAALMALMSAKIGYLWLKKKPINHMDWLSLGLVLFFGTATLIFHNESFIKLKPTVLYWIAAIAFEVSYRFYGKNLAQSLLKPALASNQILISNEGVWKKTHHWFTAFFWALGLINLVIVMLYDMNTWVLFKTIGLSIILVIAMSALMFFLYRNRDVTQS